MSNGIDFKKIALENRDLLNAALAREDVLREELESIKASIDGYDSPEHAAQVADELGNQCSALQQRLTVAEQLLRRVIACGELTRINHAELEVDVCKWLKPVTPAEPVTFGHEYNNLSVAERSAMQVTARIQEVAALKPAEENTVSCKFDWVKR